MPSLCTDTPASRSRTSRGRVFRRGIAAVAITATALGALPALAASAADPVPATSLTFTLTHSPSALQGGDVINGTATATNNGPADAPNVTILVQLNIPVVVSEVHTTLGACVNNPFRTDLIQCSAPLLANGQSMVVTYTGQTYNDAGIYTMQGGVASDAPDPTPANRLATDTLLLKQGPTFGQLLTKGLYQKLLGRAPSDSEVTYWSTLIDRGYQVPNVPFAIITSAEYRAIEVNRQFNLVLGRNASPAERTYWSGWLAGRPFDDLTLALINATEFRIPRPGPNGLVNAIYQIYVGHPADAAGASYWTARISNGASPLTLARALASSRERVDQLTNKLFQDTYGHGPMAYDRWIWRTLVNQPGGITWEHAWANLLNSYEYTKQFSVGPNCCVPLPVNG